MATETKVKGKLKAEGAVEITAQTANTVPFLNGSKEVTSSAVTPTELGYLSGTTSSIQDQLDDKASQVDLDNHINDTTGAHAASAISNIPSGNLAATDQQAANNELQSDIDTRALDSAVIKKDGSVAFTADQSMGGFKLTSLATPTAASDAATKGYVDSALEGLKPKEAVRVATTANITLSGTQTIDGVSVVAGNRVLVKNQTDATENGIYVASASAWSRSADFDSVSPIDEVNKAFVAVQEGSANAGKIYVQFGVVTAIGTDNINFTFFNSISGLTGDDGIAISGSSISVDQDGEGLTFVAGQLALELDGATLTKSSAGLKLGNTTVSPGTWGAAPSQTISVVVDAQGRLTSISEQDIDITASQVNDFNEAAQDAVGGILTDSSSVDFTYNDAGNTISAVVLPAGVDHNSLNNYVANEHVDHSTVQIQTASNSGLSGGGDITASRSLVVDITGTTSLGAAPDNADEFLVWDSSATARRKVTYAQILSGVATGSPGDIAQTSFSSANNQAAPANVTGFAFANASVRSFKAQVSVFIDATTDLFEAFDILGIQKGSSWDISIIATGDTSGIEFSITNAGQIQYTSTNVSGFSSGTIKFRALVTNL